ncbi:hypothetical protein [Thiolapillus sp.]
MDLTSIELSGSIIADVQVLDEEVRVRFEPAYLIKTMTGSDERTRWRQNIDLIFENGELLEGGTIDLPATCAGGDVGENIYTYRDMIPIPLESRGQAHCNLRVEGSPLCIQVQAEGVRLAREGMPRYIEHLRNS